jgi:hypothetical protein
MPEKTMVHPETGTRGVTRCIGCGAELASDQRYCLECGKPKSDPRVDYASYLPAPAGAQDGEPPADPPPDVAATPADNRPQREVTPLMAATGLASLVILLLLGVLIGRMGGESSQPVVATTGLPTTSSSTTVVDENVSFTADWPEGKEGFTVELATLATDTEVTAVEATKADLTAKGATELGVLKSDDFASLPTGNYVFYSGVFDKKADAKSRLKELKGSFPDAQVISVSEKAGGAGGGNLAKEDAGPVDTGDAASASDFDALEGADAEEYQEQVKKLPDEVATDGKQVKPDNKAPGAGGPDAVEIG